MSEDRVRAVLAARLEKMTESSGGQANFIMSQREDLGLAAICIGVVLLSIAGIVAALLTGLLPSLDGLLLVLVCLMMAAIFAPPLLALAKQNGWLPSLRRKQKTSSADSAPKDSGEGK
jgi:hypothetical protein